MWPCPQGTTALFKFTEEFLNGKLHFLCSAVYEVRNFLATAVDARGLTEPNLPNTLLQLQMICFLRKHCCQLSQAEVTDKIKKITLPLVHPVNPKSPNCAF